MPEQFTVPQFIDAEDKIFGPVTARQFVIMMVVLFFDFALFKLVSFVMFLLIGIPLIMIGGVIAFVKINGQPFHYFFLNVIQTMRKPKLRVWRKDYSDAEVRLFFTQIIPEREEKFQRKLFAEHSRLQELSLVVNTGGVYKPEE